MTNTMDGYRFLKSKEQILYYFDESTWLGLIENAFALNGAKEVPVIAPIRTNEGEIQATVKLGASIRNNSSNKLNAFQFIKILLCEQTQNDKSSIWYLPVRNSSIEKRIEDAKELEYRDDTSNGDIIQFKQLPESYYAQFAEDFRNISICRLEDNEGNKLLFDYMMPYFENEQSYSECITKAKAQLEIYITQ